MKKIVSALLLTGFFAVSTLAFSPAVGAVNVIKDVCDANPSAEICADDGSQGNAAIQNVINLLLFAIGIIAVIVIIIGGIKYVTSDGDSSKLKGARETILYAVVGLVIALLAYSIVRFVVGRF